MVQTHVSTLLSSLKKQKKQLKDTNSCIETLVYTKKCKSMSLLQTFLSEEKIRYTLAALTGKTMDCEH